MIRDELAKIISEREKDLGNEDQLWAQEIKLLTKNINETINFLRNECTFEEFDWISEVFDRVAEVVQSMDYLNCLYEVNDKFVKQGYTDNKSIIKCADFVTIRPYEQYLMDHADQITRPEDEKGIIWCNNDETLDKYFKQRDELERRYQQVLANNSNPNQIIDLIHDN